jgi:8-oxo-dGTP diphosphatase
MTSYVLGFMLDERGEQVVLIRKNKPTWQAGKWNGVGGKIEPGEVPIAAMVREFAEETSRFTSESDWDCFCKLHSDDFEVFCFRAHSDAHLKGAMTVTDETVCALSVAILDRVETISNILWLVHMALDKNDGAQPFFATVEYGSKHDQLAREAA